MVWGDCLYSPSLSTAADVSGGDSVQDILTSSAPHPLVLHLTGSAVVTGAHVILSHPHHLHTGWSYGPPFLRHFPPPPLVHLVSPSLPLPLHPFTSLPPLTQFQSLIFFPFTATECHAAAHIVCHYGNCCHGDISQASHSLCLVSLQHE